MRAIRYQQIVEALRARAGDGSYAAVRCSRAILASEEFSASRVTVQ
ncbi:MAG: hypothetical protein R2705_17420 [Ilumatobacteraceae bacterium]